MAQTLSTAVLTADETAAFLRLEPAIFRRKRRALERAGFPRPLPGLKNYARVAVEAFVAGAAGQTCAAGAARRPLAAANDAADAPSMDYALAYIREQLDQRLAEGA